VGLAVSAAAAAVLALATAFLQLGAIPALFPGGAAPLLPIALITAWAAARDPDGTWPVLLIVPVILGVASQERVGWFMLALLPTAALALAAGRGGRIQRIAFAPATAVVGALLYLMLLTLAAGRGSSLVPAAGSHLATALWTAAAAALLAVALRALRPRAHGLFE